MTATSLSRAILERSSKSFALAAKLLPRDVRDDVTVLYAYCRRLDDAVDLAPSIERAREALARFEAEVDDIYSGRPLRDPIATEIASLARRRGIPRAYPAALLRGMAMDVEGRRYETLADVLDYAWCVAGVVGLMMCHVLGVTTPDALVNAARLGVGMQLTNIARDVAEDAARGRSYLPAEWLSAAEGTPSDRAAAATRRLLDEASRFYESGLAGVSALSFRAGLAVRVAAYVYRAIGARVLASAGNPEAPRAYVSAPCKAWLVARAIVSSVSPRALRLRPFSRASLDGVLLGPDAVHL